MCNHILRSGLLVGAGLIGYKIYQMYKDGELDELLREFECNEADTASEKGISDATPESTDNDATAFHPDFAEFWNTVLAELRNAVPSTSGDGGSRDIYPAKSSNALLNINNPEWEKWMEDNFGAIIKQAIDRISSGMLDFDFVQKNPVRQVKAHGVN